MNLASNFYEHLCQEYPGLKSELKPESISPQLLSPHRVQLKAEQREEIIRTIQAFDRLRNHSDFSSWLMKKPNVPFNPGNRGVFMSYDFHVTQEGNLKLIEINTNASFLALGFEFAKMQKANWNQTFHLHDLKSCFASERQLMGLRPELSTIQITDDQPEQQKLYAEFLLYREVFKSWGANCQIKDVTEVSQADVIYNRSTDFFLTEEKSKKLRELFESKKVAVTPNPYEYFACADKNNFIDWSTDCFWESMQIDTKTETQIRSVLPRTIAFSNSSVEEIWQNRKNLFFKPKNSFGSKMSYKGASISRKAFDELLKVEALAQELIAPSELTFGEQTFKFDLRCYAYKGLFQGCMARLYQGQVTNLRTDGGGFATVDFI